MTMWNIINYISELRIKHTGMTYVFMLFLLMLAGCQLNDNDRPVPSYIYVSDPVMLAPGTINTPDSHKITDVWVIADGQLLGIFPLPAYIPLEVTGNETQVEIRGGIRNNGMNENSVEYAFFEPVFYTYTAQPLDTVSVPLVFRYKDNIKMPVNESFEGNVRFNTNLNPNNPVNIIISTDDFSTGSRSGLIELTPENNFIELASNDGVRKESHSRGRSFVEFDYKGDDEIAVGVAKLWNGNLDVQYVLFVPGKKDWNRIYVDITNVVSPHDFDIYYIVLGVTKLTNSAVSRTYIDNVRHVHL